MSDSKGMKTAYPNIAPKERDQPSNPGLESEMDPYASPTLVERWSRNGEPYLEEYRGSEKLKGKACIVTGGDSGIGRSVAVGFAREGANVTIAYVPVEEKDAQKTKQLIEAAGQEALLIAVDLREHSNRAKIVREHLAKFEFLDVLVNNASQQIQCQNLAEIDMAKVEDTFQTNIVQMIGMCKEAIPHMRRGGNIINTASVTAYKGSATFIDYSATKGAITAFTRSLALQLMDKQIRVNSVNPGPVYTPLQPASRSAEQMKDWGVEEVALHGRVAQPAELIESYVYLATSNLSTGTAVHPNSGTHFIA